VIGQAAEFDYSGTQACLACREAGVRTVLVNSNPATIQTDPHVADSVYIEPLTVESLEDIIALEQPDGIIATVGGQTALNLAVALDEAGVLRRYGVEILGTGLEAIRRGEDRDLFARTLEAAGQPILPSEAVMSVEDALCAADRLGYPVMCRSAFALGGAGSGIAADPAALRRQVEIGLRSSGSGQVLIEKSVYGWSEIEYEIVRDANGAALAVCNMENIDPMGVHTGDSIVVAPSQTLTDLEYHLLRAASLAVVDALGVKGACNVQLAFDRETGRYFVIEVNPRLSRSSALASKATGYPIAKVATRIALGQSLPEIRNEITGTSAFFEPALDYVVVKIPRWPFDKFRSLPPAISTRMRSTGEVMAIGRTFEEAMRKALRSMDQKEGAAPPDLEDAIRSPNAARLPAILTALREGWEPERIVELSRIHPWFVQRLAEAALQPPGAERSLAVYGVRAGLHTNTALANGGQRAKALDYRSAGTGVGETTPVFKMVDTCAAEFEARTPYFYRSEVPGGHNEALPLPGPKAIILGAGPIRIGQGIEFDYATVHACRALSQAGVRSIIINNNPETVSTDYSTSDRLYFEPLDIDAVMAVVENEGEGLLGVIPQFGGQTAINLVDALRERGVPILGTRPEWIDAAENRRRTSAILTTERIPAPEWRSIDSWERLLPAVEAVGFPALLRPSYVLSGEGMTIVRTADDVARYLEVHGGRPLDQPLLIDQFLEGAIELNVDAVFDGHDVVSVVMEQIEECGVHSGDSADVYPPHTVPPATLERVDTFTRALARAFNIHGLMNVQYAVHRDIVYVLEVNPRASRSVPFASKASGIPLADLGVRVILGEQLRDLDIPDPRQDRVCIKNVVLPFRVFPDLPAVLGPEMQSTGESMGIGRTFATAYWKAWLGAGMKHLPFGRTILLAGMDGKTVEELETAFRASGCSIAPPGADPASAALVVALGRSGADLDLLRSAANAGVPTVSTEGGVRALLLALEEGRPDLAVETESLQTQVA
jgi:carbamoyl-phosphate synthase large subunit